MRLLLVGDLIEDLTWHCECSRISPEAPVPILTRLRRETSDGGAGLVAANLKGLDIDPVCIYGSKSLKERYYVGTHLVCRVDDDHVSRVPSVETYRKVKDTIPNVDAIIVSDYCKGTVDFSVASLCVKSGKPCFVDSKNSHIEWFRGDNVTLFPNTHEYERHVRGKESLFGAVIWKRGPLGCCVFTDRYKGVDIPSRKRSVADVVGAGDAFLATYIWAYRQGMDILEAARIANDGAGVCVEHLGPYPLTEHDLKG